MENNKIIPFGQLSSERQSEWIDRLFARLGAMYGSRFAAMWEGHRVEAVKAIWREDLAELEPYEISVGVNACKTRDWPPTLPEFIKLCRPTLDAKAAWIEAVEQMRLRVSGGGDRWSSPRVYWAAAKIGAFDLQALSWESIRHRWERALAEAAQDPVPAFRPALPAPGETTLTRDEARARLAGLRDEMARRVA